MTFLAQVKDIDQYGRNVAACSLKAPSAGAKGEDVNAYMVQTGHATAYRWVPHCCCVQDSAHGLAVHACV